MSDTIKKIAVQLSNMPGQNDDHAILSPSKIHQWSHCTASVKYEKQFPEPPSSDFALEGSYAHLYAELCLKYNLDPMAYVGRPFCLEASDAQNKKLLLDQYKGNFSRHKTHRVDREMATNVCTYIDMIIEIASQSRNHTIFIEQKLKIDQYIPMCFGTADCIIIIDKTAYVIDLKYGKGVKVENLDQLRVYALGVIQTYPEYEIDDFELLICQPRLDHVASESITAKELNKWYLDVVFKALVELESPEAVFRPSESTCRWCRAKAYCQALADETTKGLFQDEFSIDDIAAEDLADYLRKIPLMKSFISAIEERAVYEMTQGTKLKGWKLVEGRSNRKWRSNDEMVAEELGKYLSDEDLWSKKLLTPAQAEKLLDKDVIKELWEKTPGKITFAPESDKRKEVNPLFSDIQA